MTSGGFRGGSGGSLEPPSETKLFQFYGEIYEKLDKMLKTNPLLMDVNPPSRNPGSAPDDPYACLISLDDQFRFRRLLKLTSQRFEF